MKLKTQNTLPNSNSRNIHPAKIRHYTVVVYCSSVNFATSINTTMSLYSIKSRDCNHRGLSGQLQNCAIVQHEKETVELHLLSLQTHVGDVNWDDRASDTAMLLMLVMLQSH